MNNSSNFEISASLFETLPSIKCHALKSQNWMSAGALVWGNMAKVLCTAKAYNGVRDCYCLF